MGSRIGPLFKSDDLTKRRRRLDVSHYKNQLIEIISNDIYIMSILKAVEKLNINDSWVCAGLIRNEIWDTLHNIKTPINDIDVIYFDRTDISIDNEKRLERALKSLMPNQPWSVKNQARMHEKNGVTSYSSSYDGVAHFPEVPTAIAVKLQENELEVISPYGLTDLFNKIVKPTPVFKENSKLYSIYIKRMEEKKWNDIWQDLYIEM